MSEVSDDGLLQGGRIADDGGDDDGCQAGTIANAFSDNPVYNDPIAGWDNKASKRIIKLRDVLLKELKL